MGHDPPGWPEVPQCRRSVAWDPLGRICMTSAAAGEGDSVRHRRKRERDDVLHVESDQGAGLRVEYGASGRPVRARLPRPVTRAMPAGSFPRSSESRTTERHAFKPPEQGGTVSQSRAERWQTLGGVPRRGAVSPASARSAKAPSPKRSPSPPKVPPGKAIQLLQKPLAKDDLDLKKVYPPEDHEDAGSLTGFTEHVRERLKWFTWEPLNPLPGRHGPHDFGPPRLGMSHPPKNAKVRKELLAYLYARKAELAPPLSCRSGRDAAVGPRQVRPPKRIKREKRQHEPEADVFSPVERVLEDLPETWQTWVESFVLRSSSHFQEPKLDRNPGRSKRMRKSSSLPLLRDLRSSTEDQVGTQTEILRQNSRYLGWELAERDLKDLGELTIFHNKMLRFRRGAQSPPQASPAQRLYQLRMMMEHQDGHDQGPAPLERVASPARTSPQTLHFEDRDSGPLTTGGDASPARLRRLAHQMQYAGPGRVQLMARAVGMNVATGGRRNL
eukprot:g15525.t1